VTSDFLLYAPVGLRAHDEDVTSKREAAMEERSGAPTLVVDGRLDQSAIDYIESRLALTQLPRDHAMIWVDARSQHRIHITIDYGIGTKRLHAEATGASVTATADECVDQLLWQAWS
jgi:hypothetical protein